MKKVIWALVLIGLVGAASAAAWRWRKVAQANSLPTGIVSVYRFEPKAGAM